MTNEIKIGDLMVLTQGSYPESRAIVRVTKLTQTQVCIDGVGELRRFRRGGVHMEEIGRGNKWHVPTLRVATPELIEAVRVEKARERAISAVRGAALSKLTTDQLERMAAILYEPPAA